MLIAEKCPLHREEFSPAFRQMVAACLQRDPEARPTASSLRKLDFFAAPEQQPVEDGGGSLAVREFLATLEPLIKRESDCRG